MKKLFKCNAIVMWIVLLLLLTGCDNQKLVEGTASLTSFLEADSSVEAVSSTDNIPEYTKSPYVIINNHVPEFTESDLTTASYEYYSELDALGRCGVAYACIGTDLMPTEERGAIGSIKPSGWQTVKYDNVDGKYLYNRCHLIGYQLSGENANEKNLITGTRYMNVEGMLPFENLVADYVKETGNHVMYRVTPVFEGNNLLASGVQMEALSVEDNGEGVMFNVYCYNVQPDILIDYASGNSSLNTQQQSADSQNEATDAEVQQTTKEQNEITDEDVQQTTMSQEDSLVIGNKNTKVFHRPSCSRLPKEKNSITFQNREEAMAAGYENPCDYCKP